MDVVNPQRSQVWLVSLEPTRGSEINKTRPCVVVSPDETNRLLRTVIVAPLTATEARMHSGCPPCGVSTSTIKNYPTRLSITFGNRSCSIALDQIRTVDKSRLIKKLGVISASECQSVADILIEMFSS